MQHSAIVNKKDIVIVFTKTQKTDMPEIKVWKLSSTNVLTEITDIIFVVYKLSDTYYKCGFTAPDEDCYLCIKFANDVSFVRVGSPVTKLLHYSESSDLSYKQIDAADGTLVSEGNLNYLNNGFFYKEIQSTLYSLIEIRDSSNIYKTISVLKLPYPTENSGGGQTNGYSAISNFVEIEKLAMIGFLGERKSGFDRTLGKWIYQDSEVKAADLARSVTYRYGLAWDKDENEELWIGNYVKYIKTQESTGSALVYRPGSTPENNKNNFNLIIDDIQGNTIVRGLAIYVTKPLETISSIEGAVLGFRNKED